MTTRVEHADMLEAIPRLVAEGVVCDAVCCDPPYHLTSLPSRTEIPGKWGQRTEAQKLARSAAGFMQSAWDTDIAFRPETWATVATILRPGAFLVAFGGTRTYHRLASAIEAGGFIIQDSILDMIASDARVKRFVATLTPGQVDAFSQVLDDMQPTGALAWAFATGFPKRRDNLKPAFEPIVLAYKPGGKRTMQIDECRIGGGEDKGVWPITDRTKTRDILGNFTGHSETDKTTGRWPANVCHDGSDEVLAAFAAYGESTSVGHHPAHRGGAGMWSGSGGGLNGNSGPEKLMDTGSAARFFMSAKAGHHDRWGSLHPTVKPVELMKWLVALVTPPGGTCIDPFAGSGTTGVAALATGRNAILIEREDAYVADVRERMAHYEGGGRHSLASKARQAKPRGETPLFDRPYDETADAIGSYNDAVRAVGATIKEGAPVPAFFLSDKPEAAE